MHVVESLAIRNQYHMQVALSYGQSKWRHLVTKLFTNASGATWWLNFQQMHVVESLAICNQYHMQVALADGQSIIVGILQSRQITFWS